MGNTQSQLAGEGPEYIVNEENDCGDYSLGDTISSHDDGDTAEKRKFCSIAASQTIVSPEPEKNNEDRTIACRKKMRISAIDDADDTNVVSNNSMDSKTVGNNDIVHEDLSPRKEMDSCDQKIILPQSESQMRLSSQGNELKSSQEHLKITNDGSGNSPQGKQGGNETLIIQNRILDKIPPRSGSQKRLNAQDSELESFQRQLKALENSKNDLSRQLQDAKWKNESLKQFISVKERTIEENRNDHRERLNTLESEVTNLRNQLIEVASDGKKLKQVRKEAEKLKKARDRWKAENRTLQTKLVSIQKKESGSLETMEHSQSAIMSKLESLLQQRKEDKTEVEELKNELKSRQNQVMSLLDEKEGLEKKLTIAQSDIAAHQQEVLEKDHFIVETTHHYESRLSKLQKENEALVAKEQSQSNAISILFKEMRDTDACRYREKDSGCQKVKAQETDVMVSHEQVRSLDEEKKELIKLLDARESDIKGLQTQVKSLDHEKVELTKLVKVRESDMERLQTFVRSLDDENSKLTKQKKAHGDDMKGSQKQFKKSLVDLTERLEARESDVKRLQDQLKSSNDEKREFIKQSKAHESEIERLRTKVQSLDEEKRELTKQLEARESVSKESQQTVKLPEKAEFFQQSKDTLKEVKEVHNVKDREAEIAALRKENESLASSHSAALLKLKNTFEEDQHRLQADNEKLQKQVNRRIEAIGLLQEQLDILEDDTMRLNRLMENTNKAHTTALSKLSEEKLVLQNTLKAQNKELQLLRSKSEKDVEDQAKLSKLEKENKALLAKEKRLKSQVERLKGSNSQLTDQKKETLRLDRKNKTIMKEVERLNILITGRTTELENLREQLKAQSKELERLVSSECSHNTAFSQLLEEKGRIEQNQILLQTNNAKLQEELDQREETIKNLKVPVAGLTGGDCQAGMGNVQLENAILAEQAQRQESMIKDLIKDLRSRAKMVGELQTRVDALSQLLKEKEPVEVNETHLQVRHTTNGGAVRTAGGEDGESQKELMGSGRGT